MSGEKVCRKCGCILWYVDASGYHYEDAERRKYTSKEPLDCPVYFGVTPGTSVKLQKELKIAAAEREQTAAALQAVGLKIRQLEDENTYLRGALEQGPKIDIHQLAQAMLELLESKRLISPDVLAIEAPKILKALAGPGRSPPSDES